mmetsp:Transcript_11630/g.24017  ORF Transcript_11630/g.24017 Transcript_11630/m.24017 type:complete len:96 (+) Transcript_11630:381-668(+)
MAFVEMLHEDAPAPESCQNARQGSHCPSRTALRSGWKVPAGHGRGRPEKGGQKNPAGHGSIISNPPPPIPAHAARHVQKYPSGHGSHDAVMQFSL